MTSEIVPDGFDLDDARNARSSTPDGERKRCPGCGSASIDPKSNAEKNTPRQLAGEWRCNDCGTHFEEPAREARP